MPVLKTNLGRRLSRWQLAHTAPAPLSIDHPVQEDLAAAIDMIERLEDRAEKAKQLIEHGAPACAADALDGYYDNEAHDTKADAYMASLSTDPTVKG